MSQEVKVILLTTAITIVTIIGSIIFLSNTKQVQSPATPEDTTILNRNLTHTVGPTDAKVRIVEFADFQCPACKAASPEVRKILDKYNGKISYSYRHFPLPQHRFALQAARAAEAAGEQGKFWEMSEQLFANQSDWSTSNNPTDLFVNYAKTLNLDTTAFSNNIASDKYDNQINQDKADGQLLSISATPTFFINNKKVTLQSFTDLEKYIDEALKKE